MVRRYLYTVLAVLTLVSVGLAQDDSTAQEWNTSLVANLTLTQTSYSDSWDGGEAGSVNWVSNVDGSAERQLGSKLNFKSVLRLKFGQTLTQNIETDADGNIVSKPWSKPKKSTDLIDWENVARFTYGGWVDPYAAFRLETQFFDGKVEAKKLYFSPLKLTESFGVARQFYKKDESFVASRLGAALRQIIKTSVVDLSTLETADSTISDGGLESVTDATLNLGKNAQYVGKLTLYKALFSSESGREHPIGATIVGSHWSSLDINWENTVTAQVTSLVAVSLYTQLLYDKDVDLRGRFKETLGLGVTYKLM